MGLINKITTSWYDTTFTVSDDANIIENYNYASSNTDGVLQSIYRYFQDHERRRNLNCIYRGFSASINGTDLEVARAGSESAEAIIAGRIVAMDDNPRIFDIAEASPPEVFTADATNFLYIEHSTITESFDRDGSSGEIFIWKITTDISAFDDHQLVICSVDVDVGKTAFSNLVQLANPYEVEANKFRPKYDHSMGFYVGDGHIQSRSLSVLMDWDDTTFYLPIKVDVIDEKTTDAGVTVEGVLIKDDIIDTSGSFTVDTITEHTTDAGVTVESVAMEDGDIDSAGGLTINTIDEHTIAAGVTVEGMLIKDITAIKADTDILYVNTIDDYSGGTTTITPNVIISGTLDVTGDFDINSKLTVAAGTGDTLILGTLGVTGLVTGTAGFSGALTGNVVGNVTGDVTGKADTADAWETTRTIGMTGDVSSDNVNIDGSANVTITNTVIANDSHTHITANITDLDTASTDITKVGTITTGVWNGTAITNTNINSITTSKISDLDSADTGITIVGTIGTGVWQGSVIADAYIANDITLTNLTQITTSDHADLTVISVDDHHNQRTQNFTLINTAQTSHTKNGIGNQTWSDYSLRMAFTNADINYARIKGAWLSSATGTSGNSLIRIQFEFPDATNIVVDSESYTSADSGYEYFDTDLSSYLAKFVNGIYKVQVYISNTGSNLDGTGQIYTISLDIG